MEEIRLMCRGNELVLAQLGPPDATSAHADTVGTTVFSCENGNPCEDPTPKDFIKKEEGTPYATCTSGVNKIYLYKDASTLDHIWHDYENRYANNAGGRDLQLGYQSGPKTNEVFIQTVNGGFECTFLFLIRLRCRGIVIENIFMTNIFYCFCRFQISNDSFSCKVI